MQIDVHHLILDEFLKISLDIATSGPKAVIAVGGMATFANSEAMRLLTPDEVALCIKHLQGSDVADGESVAMLGPNGFSVSLHTKSMRSRNLVLGRVARIASAGPTKRNISDRPQSDQEGDWSLERMTRRQIANALRRTEGNRVRAAQLLGISRSSLYRKLAQFDLSS